MIIWRRLLKRRKQNLQIFLKIYNKQIKFLKLIILLTKIHFLQICLFVHANDTCYFQRTEKTCVRGNDSTTHKQWKHEKTCGRPLGLRFDKENGDLYIADAYYGLLKVGPNGGLATPLSTHVGGKPILFANDLDIHKNGSIFFTDTSKRYNRV
jgi:sugar lactone lactonase YvrE